MLEKLTFSKFYLAKSEWISFFFIASWCAQQDLSNDVFQVEKFQILRKLTIFTFSFSFLLFSFILSFFFLFFFLSSERAQLDLSNDVLQVEKFQVLRKLGIFTLLCIFCSPLAENCVARVPGRYSLSGESSQNENNEKSRGF